MASSLPSLYAEANMKPVTALVGLLLVSSALACPVKKGFIAGGLLPLPAGYVPKCDDWYASSKQGLQSSLGTGQKMSWFEMYAVDAKALKFDNLIGQLTRRGYTSVMKTDYGGMVGRRLRDKAGRMLDVSARKMEGNNYFVSLSLIKF
jgi:hypothetical protein